MSKRVRDAMLRQKQAQEACTKEIRSTLIPFSILFDYLDGVIASGYVYNAKEFRGWLLKYAEEK